MKLPLPLRSLIAAITLLPALASCSGGESAADAPIDPAEMVYLAEKPGVNREALHRAIDPLFTDEAMAQTRAVVVMYQGRVVAERYAPGYHENTRFVSWSMAKTVTSVVIGMLVADGRLSLDRAAPVPSWQQTGDPRGEITLRHLLQMRAGLKHEEAGEDITKADTPRMLFLDGHDDVAAYAEAQPLEAEPGRSYEYSSASSMILADIATRALFAGEERKTPPTADERQKAMSGYLRNRLVEPLGLESFHAEYDASGTMLGGSLIHATARDWARFGEFLRNGGSVKGVQIVPRGWIEFMREPSPADGGYGGHMWLNRNRPEGRPMNLSPGRGPDTLFAALGHLGQYIIVSPDQKLVIVRLGNTPDDGRGPVRDQLFNIVELYE